MTEFHSIREWNRQQLVGRIGVISSVLQDGTTIKGKDRDHLLDEVVVILLEILKHVLADAKEVVVKPVEIFASVYGSSEDPLAQEVLERFRSTEACIDQFRVGDDAVKKALRKTLKDRGML